MSSFSSLSILNPYSNFPCSVSCKNVQPYRSSCPYQSSRSDMTLYSRLKQLRFLIRKCKPVVYACSNTNSTDEGASDEKSLPTSQTSPLKVQNQNDTYVSDEEIDSYIENETGRDRVHDYFHYKY